MIVITAPTGAIGHQVLENVLRGEEPIRLIARDPSRLPSPLRDRIHIVQGSHSDTAVVNKAFAGADAVFWLVPPDPRATTVDGEPALSLEDVQAMFVDKRLPEQWESWGKFRADWIAHTSSLVLAAETEYRRL